MLDKLCKYTKSLEIRETAFKVLTRWYRTPSELQPIFPGTSGLCFHGCPIIGNIPSGIVGDFLQCGERYSL